ncbi:MAG: Ku protein [Myxococcota bacterium]
MSRSIWNGTIGFGLVQIPVTLHSAEDHESFDMTMLDKRDMSPIGYERVNKKTGKPVPWKDVVKGYEAKKGKYVILNDADFEQANVEASKQMDITDFVEFSSIDPRYFNRPYYLAPQKNGKKAYALLRETLHRTGKAGIGKIVLRTRQHLAAVVAHEKLLLLVMLRFADELRDESDLELPPQSKSQFSPKELSMAEKLVEGMVSEFKPEKYEDEYHRDLMKLIQRKVKAGEVNVVSETHAPKPQKQTGAKVIDLAALLAQSVEGGKKSKSSSRPRRAKRKTASHSERHTHRKSA